MHRQHRHLEFVRILICSMCSASRKLHHDAVLSYFSLYINQSRRHKDCRHTVTLQPHTKPQTGLTPPTSAVDSTQDNSRSCVLYLANLWSLGPRVATARHAATAACQDSGFTNAAVLRLPLWSWIILVFSSSHRPAEFVVHLAATTTHRKQVDSVLSCQRSCSRACLIAAPQCGAVCPVRHNPVVSLQSWQPTR